MDNVSDRGSTVDSVRGDEEGPQRTGDKTLTRIVTAALVRAASILSGPFRI